MPVHTGGVDRRASIAAAAADSAVAANNAEEGGMVVGMGVGVPGIVCVDCDERCNVGAQACDMIHVGGGCLLLGTRVDR